MIPLDKARARVIREVKQLSPRKVLLAECRGLTLATTLVSRSDVPNFATAAMDGFAVRADDLADASPLFPVALRVTGMVSAGAGRVRPLTPGRGRRIMTGAPVPAGADAVVMHEKTRQMSEEIIEFRAPAGKGENIRPSGNDLKKGDTVFRRGHILGAVDIGVLSSLGLSSVLVHPRPRVGVASTGDELMLPGRRLRPGCIYDSNLPTILASLEAFGVPASSLGLWSDDLSETVRALRRHSRNQDVLVTTGGVSEGDFDYLPEALERAGGKIIFHHVRLKPGKPFLFGRVGKCLLFAMPGNPQSVVVGIHFFLFPALARMMGRRVPPLRFEEATLASSVRNRGDRPRLVAGRASVKNDGGILAAPGRKTSSGALSGYQEKNCFIYVPAGEKHYGAGEKIKIAWMTYA